MSRNDRRRPTSNVDSMMVLRARRGSIAVTHSGVTMSPFLGAAVADEIIRGRQRTELTHFRPARFFN
jgi:glycine/D-amino acid oxidase-like deaminating enzyme